jgi:hypothetical protein
MPGLFEPISRHHFFSDQLVERPFRRLGSLLLTAAILIAISPAVSTGQTVRPPERLVISDVGLGPQGQWAGEIVDAQGIGVSGLSARLSNSRGPVAGILTDSKGRFALGNMTPGVHLLSCRESAHLYRFWKHGTAPPKAVRHALIVVGGDVTRGVQGSRIYDWLADHPGLTYAGIAAAIAVPIVVAGSDANSRPASP